MRSITFRLTISVASMLSMGGCGGPLDGADQLKQPIYNGAVASDVAQQGVGQILDGEACSAVVYSRYWLITAAHCFDPAWDTNGDGEISGSERPSPFFARFLAIDNSGTLGSIEISAAFRHPNSGTWGHEAIFHTDVALVHLDPTSNGVSTSVLYAVNYSNGKLRIYSGSTASLQDSLVLAFGWGRQDSSGPGDGMLHKAWKQISKTDYTGDLSGAYNGIPFNDAGTSCPGDSGGPDYHWDGSAFQMTAVHSTGPLDCTSGVDGDIGAQMWRDWVTATAL
jgi:Trypsin